MYISGLYGQNVFKSPLWIRYEVDSQMERINAKIINTETRSIERKSFSIGTYDIEGRLYIPVGVFLDELV